VGTSPPLACASQVLLELRELLQKFSAAEGNMVVRIRRFLEAQGYKQELDELDSSLQACLGQLTCIVSISQLAAKVGTLVWGWPSFRNVSLSICRNQVLEGGHSSKN
jgi:hypothetical protein